MPRTLSNIATGVITAKRTPIGVIISEPKIRQSKVLYSTFFTYLMPLYVHVPQENRVATVEADAGECKSPGKNSIEKTPMPKPLTRCINPAPVPINKRAINLTVSNVNNSFQKTIYDIIIASYEI